MYDYDNFDELDQREPISEYLTPKEVMELLYIGKNTLSAIDYVLEEETD